MPHSVIGRCAPRRRDGFAVLVVLALVAILLTYVAYNLRTLSSLDREVKLIEQHQLRRLHPAQHRMDLPHAADAAPASANNQPLPQ